MPMGTPEESNAITAMGRPGSAHFPWTVGNRLLGVDPQRVRVWVGGQRLHHGATGIALIGAAAARLAADRRATSRWLAWALAGGALVAHDWKDRSVWFRRGS
jgi:hypothetical protein